MPRQIFRTDGTPLSEATFVEGKRRKPTLKQRAQRAWDEVPPEVQHQIGHTAGLAKRALDTHLSRLGEGSVLEKAKQHLEERKEMQLTPDQQAFLRAHQAPFAQASPRRNPAQWLDVHAPKSIHEPLLRSYGHLGGPDHLPQGPGGQLKQTLQRSKPLIKDLRKAYDYYKILKGP